MGVSAPGRPFSPRASLRGSESRIPIASPTFVIARVYLDGFLPLVHADVYRLGSILEFEDLDLEETAASGVLVIEWGEAIEDAVSPDRLVIEIEIDGETGRQFRFLPHGSWLDRPLEGVV